MDTADYLKNYTVKTEHIDVQGIMDGLYYPFYMEDCRHEFVREVMGFDIELEARNGINMILTEYTIKFLRSLKKDDSFSVTCTLFSNKTDRPIFHIKQKIIMNGKTMTEATFTATCIRSSSGRPFLPDNVLEVIKTAKNLES